MHLGVETAPFAPNFHHTSNHITRPTRRAPGAFSAEKEIPVRDTRTKKSGETKKWQFREHTSQCEARGWQLTSGERAPQTSERPNREVVALTTCTQTSTHGRTHTRRGRRRRRPAGSKPPQQTLDIFGVWEDAWRSRSTRDAELASEESEPSWFLPRTQPAPAATTRRWTWRSSCIFERRMLCESVFRVARVALRELVHSLWPCASW